MKVDEVEDRLGLQRIAELVVVDVQEGDPTEVGGDPAERSMTFHCRKIIPQMP